MSKQCGEKTFVSKLAYQLKYLKWKYAFSSELHIQQVPVECIVRESYGSWLGLQLPVQSVPITTNVMSSYTTQVRLTQYNIM
jgi:hypothetical protein